MKIIILIAAILVVQPAYTQWYSERYGEIPLAELNKTQLSNLLQGAKSTRTAGIVITSLGVCLVSVGLVVEMADATTYVASTLTLGAIPPQDNPGGSIIIGGFVLTVINIPLWAIGGNRKTDIEMILKIHNF